MSLAKTRDPKTKEMHFETFMNHIPKHSMCGILLEYTLTPEITPMSAKMAYMESWSLGFYIVSGIFRRPIFTHAHQTHLHSGC